VGNADGRFRWLGEVTPESRAAFQPWLEKGRRRARIRSISPVIDKATGKVAGRQTLMRIDPANGVIEIGHIYWGPLMQRKPAATEAHYPVHAAHLRRSRLPALGVEVQQPQRAVEARRAALRLHAGGRVSARSW
jgi:RimJ/RimL family protein N-acetyltransferase